jgi:hypothetical protein
MIAYVDPGNGLFLLQAAGSIVVSVVFMARAQIRKLIGKVGGVFRRRGSKTEQKNQRRCVRCVAAGSAATRQCMGCV